MATLSWIGFLLLFFFYFPVALRPNAGHGLHILEVSGSHTTTHHSRQDSSGRVISSSQRPLPDNTQQSLQTDIHAPGGTRNHDLNRRAAAELRLRPRGKWNRLLVYLPIKIHVLGVNSLLTYETLHAAHHIPGKFNLFNISFVFRHLLLKIFIPIRDMNWMKCAYMGHKPNLIK